MAFVIAYSTSTGREQLVPEHFFDSPELCRGLTQTPPPGSEPVDEQPTDEWTIQQLRDYAEPRGIDLTGLSRKGEIFDAVQAAMPAPADGADDGVDNPAVTAIGTAHPTPAGAEATLGDSNTPSTTETPATGETQE